MDQPPPFLALPLAKNVSPLKVSQGWLYSEDEKSIHPDIPTHYAVDFPVAWGTEVYAPADGMAVASYHTYDMTDSKGRIIGYGLGLFIQIWHEGPQLYSLYAHLSGVNDKLVPYMAPTLEGGNWQPRKALYVPIEEFKKNAKPVKRGDLIGHAGYTGLRLGYDETPANPVSVDPKKDKTWDPHGSHLHWEVYTRTPDGGAKDKRYDPFGLYAEKKQYAEVFQKAQGLILANPDGSPQCAR
jgi:murein DD-endopeptidase MepM/ murein hydrolase activator NlpD